MYIHCSLLIAKNFGVCSWRSNCCSLFKGRKRGRMEDGVQKEAWRRRRESHAAIKLPKQGYKQKCSKCGQPIRKALKIEISNWRSCFLVINHMHLMRLTLTLIVSRSKLQVKEVPLQLPLPLSPREPHLLRQPPPALLLQLPQPLLQNLPYHSL